MIRRRERQTERYGRYRQTKDSVIEITTAGLLAGNEREGISKEIRRTEKEIVAQWRDGQVIELGVQKVI